MAKKTTHNFAAHISYSGQAMGAGYATLPWMMNEMAGKPKAKPRKREHRFEMQIGLTNEHNLSMDELRQGLREARDVLRGQIEQQDLFVPSNSVSSLPHGAGVVDMIEGNPPSLSVLLKKNCLASDTAAREELAANWEEVKAAVQEKLAIREFRSRSFPRLTKDRGEGYMRTP